MISGRCSNRVLWPAAASVYLLFFQEVVHSASQRGALKLLCKLLVMVNNGISYSSSTSTLELNTLSSLQKRELLSWTLAIVLLFRFEAQVSRPKPNFRFRSSL